jgi:inosose dehydratase
MAEEIVSRAVERTFESVRKHAIRISHFHLKDHEPKVAAQVRQNEWDYFICVQDVLPGMGSPNQSAAKNRAYLKKLGY